MTMKQSAFDTRQRASELLQEAVAIWRQSAHSNQLEGIERDPIFSLLITALAYQSNETDSDIERIKQDVLDEYIQLLTPYEAGRPIPATAVVEGTLRSDFSELLLTEDSTFFLSNTQFRFMPLLRQRLINASISRLTRLDGRRWCVTLQFQHPQRTLNGMTFALMDTRFHDVNVTVNGRLMKLTRPWHYADMPLQPCFATESLLYNRAQLFDAANVGFDLYARQNIALFSFRRTAQNEEFHDEISSAELVFDFKGIPDDYVFDKEHLILNPIILVNASVSTVSLSSSSPIVRVSGYTPGDPDVSQLMHLIPPAEEQLYGKTPVEVRRVSSDRFNQAALLRLLNSLTTKFHSDYYAFQEIHSARLSEIIRNIQEELLKLTRAIRQEQIHSTPGVYLVINHEILTSSPNISLDIGVVTTPGAAVNNSLNVDSRFIPPAGLNDSAMRMIGEPVHGFDEINDMEKLRNYVRYELVTNDRIVTPADMKILCYTELMTRYSIIPAMVSDITVRHSQQLDKSGCGYVFWVNILLQDNPFVRRNFSDKIPEAEIFLQKRIEVRSSCIYPIYVNIQIETEI